MSLVLHDFELSADCYRARLLLGLLGCAHERVGVDVFPGRETDTPAFRALNPRGSVPVLVDGTLVLTRIGAILCHLADTRDAHGTFLPREPLARAKCLDRLFFALDALAPADHARTEAVLALPSPVSDAPALAERAFRDLESILLHAEIDGEGFLAGARPTIADVAAFPSVALAVDFGCALEAFPRLRAWTRRLRALPGFVTTPGVPEFL